MRTICLYIILTFSVCHAQNSTCTFGIRGSMDVAGLTGRDVAIVSENGYLESLTGGVIGVYLNSKPAKHVWLKHELSYARRFINVAMNDGINKPFSGNIKRLYLDIYPVSGVYQFKGLQVIAGPYVGVILNGTIQRKDSSGVLYKDKLFSSGTSHPELDISRLDAGFSCGIAYEFKIGLNVGLHYTRGFIPFIHIGAQRYNIFNQYYGFSLGYSFAGRNL